MDSSNSSKNFFKHVFNFNDDSKSDILNIIQYALIAILPIIILNKSISKYIPEVDEKKVSLEISVEVILQILIMFLGLLIIHRIITFVPTFSGVNYPDFHIIYIVLAVLMITMSLQTKLGEKINVLVERIVDFWNGKEEKNTKKTNIKVSQPISGQITGKQMNQMDSAVLKQSLYTDGTPINSLPTNENAVQQSQQALPDYNKMYQQNTTPLINADTPGDNSMQMQEPMAANSLLGSGSGFGSW
jgi:hypothetical protein